MKTVASQRRQTPQSKDKILANAIEKNRQDMSLKSMQFNRFMMVRYATAFFFFVNLYWALLMRHTWVVVIPLVIMVIASLAIVEQIKLFGTHTNQLVYSKLFFRTQAILNVVLMIQGSFFNHATLCVFHAVHHNKGIGFYFFNFSI